MDTQRRRRDGFTLLEVLVVLGIVGTLAGLTVPAVMRVREAAHRAACADNLRQIGLAVHSYEKIHRYFPVNSLPGPYGPYGPQTRGWSWLARLLPYLDQEGLARKANVANNTLYQGQGAAAARLEVFLCPSDTAYGEGPREDAADLGAWAPPFITAGQSNYKGVTGANWDWGDARWHNPSAAGSWDGFAAPDGLFGRADYLQPRRLADIKDGLSNTLLAGEAVPARSKWCSWPYANNAVGTCAIAPNAVPEDGTAYDPWDWTNTYGFGSRHPGGLHFVFADGSVRFLADGVDLATYRALATIAGGEVVSPP